MNYNREDLALAAGLFEGEGYIGAQVQRHPSKVKGVGIREFCHVRAILGMTDLDPVQRFQRTIGFGKMVRRRGQKAGWKDQYRWQCQTFEYVQALIALLWHWLSPRRREQARVALQIYHDVQRRRVPRKQVGLLMRKPICKRGHDMKITGAVRPSGLRYCILCARIRGNEWYAKNREHVLQLQKEKRAMKLAALP